MATTTTYSQALTNSAWTLIAAGSAYATVGIQAAGPRGIKVAVAASTPAVGATNWFSLSENDNSVAIPLGTGDNLYAMALGSSAQANGYLVSV